MLWKARDGLSWRADFDTPDFIKAAANEAMEQNYTHYMPVPGFADLRKVSLQNSNDNGLTIQPTVVSTG